MQINNFTFLQGIQNQADDTVYQGNSMGCQRGHLYAAMTASGDSTRARDSVASTYQYTNAVPQCGRFNMGQWNSFERRIRRYANQNCIPRNGVLYLITGISFVGIDMNHPTLPLPVPKRIEQFSQNIKKPNSMWTAGLCLLQNPPHESFAVIGNNVQNRRLSVTREISLAHLEGILGVDIRRNGLKRAMGPNVQLFPGVQHVNIQLPADPNPDPDPDTDTDTDEEEEGKGKKPPSSSSSSKPSSTSSKHGGPKKGGIRIRIG